jgi:hypothetical protein
MGLKSGVYKNLDAFCIGQITPHLSARQTEKTRD